MALEMKFFKTKPKQSEAISCDPDREKSHQSEILDPPLWVEIKS